MNTDTGQIYWGEPAIEQARARGETVVPVSHRVARLMEQSLTLETMTKDARRRAWREAWLGSREAVVSAPSRD